MAKSDAERSREYRDRKRGKPPRELAPDGTRAAAARKRRLGEPLTATDLEAERAYIRAKQAERRARLARKESPDS